MSRPPGQLRSVEEHRAAILDGLGALSRRELAPVADALGRVVASEVTAVLSVPGFDHAAMDGFAVRAASVASAAGDRPVELPVVGVVAAGDGGAVLPEGAALRIMTGAPVPLGADLVVPFEWTAGAGASGAGEPGGVVQVLRAAAAGRHIRREGEDVAAGEIALPAGSRLGPAQIGLLTSVGCTSVPVRPRPRLGVLSTGAELHPPRTVEDSRANRGSFSLEVTGMVPDSNTAVLTSAGRAAGAEVTAWGPVGDDVDVFRRRLQEAADGSDLVVTTGGVSAGDHDVVKAALRSVDGFWFGPVAMKPGRPQGHGSVRASDGRRVPVITLPGTPIAACAAFLLYAVPALRVLAGRAWRPRLVELGVDVTGTDRTVVLPGRYDEQGRIVPLPGHAGHSQRLLAAADALLVVGPTGRLLPVGTPVEVLALDPEEDR